jgi:hypothetical protein
LAGHEPHPEINISDVLLPQIENSQYQDVDLYVVGIQELVDLNLMGSITCKKDRNRMNSWENQILNGLNKLLPNHEFSCALRKIMYGCLILLFVRKDSL